jgi:hypothetical protein
MLEYAFPAKIEFQMIYNKSRDAVELIIGGASLTLNADSFIMSNKVIHKATAKIVMQTEIYPKS